MLLFEDFERCSEVDVREKVLYMLESVGKILVYNNEILKKALENETILRRGGVCLEGNKALFIASLVLSHRKVGRTLIMCKNKNESNNWIRNLLGLLKHIRVTTDVLKGADIGVSILTANKVMQTCESFEEYDRIILDNFHRFSNLDFICKVGGVKTLKWALSMFPWVCKPVAFRTVADWIGLETISCEDILNHCTIGEPIAVNKDLHWEVIEVRCTDEYVGHSRPICSKALQKVKAIEPFGGVANVILLSQYSATIALFKANCKSMDLVFKSMEDYMSDATNITADIVILLEPQLSIKIEDICKTVVGCKKLYKLILNGSIEEQIAKIHNTHGWGLHKAFDPESLMLKLLKFVL
jgi:hypothetical protein